MGRFYDVITSFQDPFILTKLGADNFADIIKIAILFIKITFKDSLKVSRITNYALECNFYLYFPISQKMLSFW